MPPPPSPQDLGVVLDRLADQCDAAVECLLAAVPVAGDRATQRAVDDYVDHVMDVLRMLAVTGRETRDRLPPLDGKRAASPPPATDRVGWSGPAVWSR